MQITELYTNIYEAKFRRLWPYYLGKGEISDYIESLRNYPEELELQNLKGTLVLKGISPHIKTLERNLEKYWERIEYLDLKDNLLQNLSFLTKCSQLKYIDLSESLYRLPRRITLDLSPLEKLFQLTILNVSRREVEGINALANLPKLEILDWGGYPVTKDLSSLVELPHLKELNLWKTLVSDWSPLVCLLQLKILKLERAKIDDLSIFAKLIQLEELYLSNTPVNV